MTEKKTKVCKKCGKRKPMSSFYSHKNMADGKLGKCKKCLNSYCREYRKSHETELREFERKRYQNPKRKSDMRRYLNKFRKLFPEKNHARSMIARLLHNGKIEKQPCSVCSKTKGVHGHHPDYTQPKIVIWLCYKHHRKLHLLLKEFNQEVMTSEEKMKLNETLVEQLKNQYEQEKEK